MSINKWMFRGYQDEGCSAYQCLNCYNSWSGRTNVSGPSQYGAYEGFVYCPFCGTKWEGEHKRVYKRHHIKRGPAEWFKYYWTLEGIEAPVYAWWVCEKRELPNAWFFDINKNPWVPQWKSPCGYNLVWQLLQRYRDEPINHDSPITKINSQEEYDKWHALPEEPTEELRLVIIKDADLESHYMGTDMGYSYGAFSKADDIYTIFPQSWSYTYRDSPAKLNPFLKSYDEANNKNK